MEFKFNIAGKERKRLAQAVGEIVGAEVKYQGVPSCNYTVSYFTIDREGTLIFDDGTDKKEVETLLEALEQKGFAIEQQTEPVIEEVLEESKCDTTSEEEPTQGETVRLTVSMPSSYFTDDAFNNLQHIIEAKGKLIKKALGLDLLPINKDDEKVSFPWFAFMPNDSDTVIAYTHFIYSICEMAKNQKRISSREKEADNEKYAFRCFLLRLGFIGEEYKKERKILLQNLSGSSAFKGGSKNEISK